VTRSKSLRYGSGVFSLAAGSGNGIDTGDEYDGNSDNAAADDMANLGNPYEDMHFGTNVMTLDLSTNWAVELNHNSSYTLPLNAAAFATPYYIYKFIPAVDSTYEYVAECSNRGLCDSETGTCECFTGYTNDACDQQDSLSL
jgi:hypothetical protein